jgi:chemotaxis protein MotB
MSAPKNAPIVIVKKRRGGHGGHHGGAWKVAYADFVTAMMAFFLVLWILGQSKAVKAAIGQYFRDPGVFDQARSDGPIPGGAAGLDPESPPAPRRERTPVGYEDEGKALEKSAHAIRQALAAMPELAAMTKGVDIFMTAEGMRIELQEVSDSTFFDSGSAVPEPGTERVLESIARELAAVPNDIIIEGHTDSRQYQATAGQYTNWELSTDRANAARRVMMKSVGRSVRGIRGYADTFLRFPDPLDPRNRRVSILVRRMERP